jgi:type I restriction enzyme M protein
MSEEQRKILKKQLWDIANLLRGKMNADEYKSYILGFIFYKYLSEKQEMYADELLKNEQGIASYREIKKKEHISVIKKRTLETLGFFLEPKQLFSSIVDQAKGSKDGSSFILDDLQKVLNAIEQTSAGTASEDDFAGLFGDVDLASPKLGKSEKAKNKVISEVLVKLDEIDFALDNSKSDILGDAYEYLLSEFAAGAGKKGGEFYTPSEVSELLAMIAANGRKKIKTVYDPTCGSGSLLLKIGNQTKVSDYYGQELNPTTYNLARMNMILHGIHYQDFDIKQEDTLRVDLHPDLKADAIVANPPFSIDWDGADDPVLAADERFSQYGKLAPKSYADYAFITHMIYHLADNGVMAVVMPHGALFRAGAEGVIRKYIVDKLDYLDAVIGLPANLFFGTSIPATIMVFKKCRKQDESIIFIDASKDFDKGKNQNVLNQEHINKIFDTYKKRKEIERYSHMVTSAELIENDYNLNIPRYIDTFEPEQEVDVNEVAGNLREINAKEVELHEQIIKYCDEIGIDKPF